MKSCTLNLVEIAVWKLKHEMQVLWSYGAIYNPEGVTVLEALDPDMMQRSLSGNQFRRIWHCLIPDTMQSLVVNLHDEDTPSLLVESGTAAIVTRRYG